MPAVETAPLDGGRAGRANARGQRSARDRRRPRGGGRGASRRARASRSRRRRRRATRRCASCSARIVDAIDERGAVLDRASPALGRIRRSLAQAQADARDRVGAILNSREVRQSDSGSDRHDSQRALRRSRSRRSSPERCRASFTTRARAGRRSSSSRSRRSKRTTACARCRSKKSARCSAFSKRSLGEVGTSRRRDRGQRRDAGARSTCSPQRPSSRVAPIASCRS